MGIEALTFFLLQLSDQTQLRKNMQTLGARQQKHVYRYSRYMICFEVLLLLHFYKQRNLSQLLPDVSR